LSSVPLTLGPLVAPGFVIQRSGLRWLCDDGHVCRPGEVIAFCNIGLVPDGHGKGGPRPFADETRDFQVALAPRVGGRVSKAADSSHGGFLDQLDFQAWTPNHIVGHIQCRPGQRPPGYDVDGGLRLLLLAGRRMTEIAEVRSGLLTGWHDRSRAWWGEGASDFGTLLSLGTCDQAGMIRGERFAFLEMFEAVLGPAQIVFVPDDALVPCAPVITEQLSRTPAQFDDIAADFATTFAAGPVVPSPSDWIFAGCLMSTLQRSPLTERYDMLTRTGLRHAGTADAVMLSLNVESESILRHRKLGYAVKLHDFRLAESGPAIRAWLHNNFERVKRTLSDIQRDYRTLIDTVRARSDTKFLVMNVMSTSGNETIYNYAPFDRPMGETLLSIRRRELNLMLHDLARERDVAIVDLDAIAAEFGGNAHLPDGVHSSGALQAEVRGEILRILRARGVPGFGVPSPR
jgi:hypothetical protein